MSNEKNWYNELGRYPKYEEAVKFMEQVAKDIEEFNKNEIIINANSHWIAQLKYEFDSKDATMILKSGKDYTFPNFSQSLFMDWAQSPSAGKFYNKYIRGLHYQKLLFKIARALATAKKAISRFLRRGE